MLLTMPLTLLLCLVASPIIRFFADSPAFADSVVVLRIVIWGLPFQAAVLVLNRLLLTADRERRFVTIGLLAMLLNVGLNALLIPVASYHGAAAATVVTMAVAFLMHLRALSGSEFRPRLRRALLGPTLATLVAGTVTAGALGSLAPHGIIGPWVLTDGAGPGAYALALAIFVPSYLAAAVVIRVIDRDDARLLASMARIPGVVGRRRGDGG
jgi:O-antigen/teichoic acid export membrane protein